MIVSRLVRHSLLSYIKPSQIGQLSFSKTFCTDIDENSYLKLTNETLESISDRFSELIEDHDQLGGGDTQLSDGVLTVKLSQHGTYVLNKQTPNKQIWLSSPVSGPYRYDISQVRLRSHCSLLHNSGPVQGVWVYRHTGQTLHTLLDEELRHIIKTDPGFHTCFMASPEPSQ